MSFVKKAVKKVFKVAKKVVKTKAFKIAAIVGLSLFTAGIAAGGWAAFSASMSAAGGGIGGFFAATGSTMAAGWTSIIGGLKTYGAGAKAFLSGQTATAGATAGAAGGFETGVGGILSSGGAAAGEGVFSAAAQAAASSGIGGGVAGLATTSGASALATTNLVSTTASQGWLGRVFGGLTSDSIGGSMLRGGIAMGVNGYFRGKERERDEFYYNNKTVWGGKAFGGTGEGINILSPVKAAPDASVAKQQTQAPLEVAAQAAAPVQQQGGLLSPQQPAPPAPTAQIESSQPPPATQPPQGRVPAGVTPEMLGVV